MRRTCLLLIATFVVSIVSPFVTATAAPIRSPNRARAQLGTDHAGGSPINGVDSDLYVSGNLDSSITGVAGDIYMSDPNGQFVQFGIVQGEVGFDQQTLDYLGNCVPRNGTRFLSSPHLFLGAKLSSQPCETLRDLGPFGSVNNRRHFGLRQRTDGTYYATLDGVLKYTTSISFPLAMEPGVVAEANDTCAYTIADAQTSSAMRTLRWHDDVRGWQSWNYQVNTYELMHPTLWNRFRPNGVATYHADGAYPSPSYC